MFMGLIILNCSSENVLSIYARLGMHTFLSKHDLWSYERVLLLLFELCWHGTSFRGWIVLFSNCFPYSALFCVGLVDHALSYLFKYICVWEWSVNGWWMDILFSPLKGLVGWHEKGVKWVKFRSVNIYKLLVIMLNKS